MVTNKWYESGILWGALMDYTAITHDLRHFETISGALSNASYGGLASFLGSSVLDKVLARITGKWNDDILWWSFGGESVGC
jgi:hypothetical protein